MAPPPRHPRRLQGASQGTEWPRCVLKTLCHRGCALQGSAQWPPASQGYQKGGGCGCDVISFM